MKYEIKSKRKIIIHGKEDFVARHILECGQIFRFKKFDDGSYVVYFGKNYAKITEFDSYVEIETSDAVAAAEFFDLDRDYSEVKKELSRHEILKKSIEYGHGIRILKNGMEETIFSFIISANNNIKRIQGIIEKLSELGDDMGDFHAFPTADQIAGASDEFLASLHAGYRTPYLKETAEVLRNVDLSEKAKLSTPELKKWLMSLKGVGPKVASCIALFGFNRFDTFPVDTWTNKVYRNHFFAGEKSRPEIEKHFLELFGSENAGLVQQYLFFAEREIKDE